MLNNSEREQLLAFGVEGTIRSSLTFAISSGRLLVEFGVEGKGNGKGEWLFFSVVDVLEFGGKDIIFPAGESGGRGAFPTPITVAYIIMTF